jgi:AAHS family 4-hydroxybenzoate transporter-like MFS transporter
MNPTPEKNSVDIAPLLDDGRWTPYLMLLVGLTALAIVFDGADIQLLGLAIPSMSKEWGLEAKAFSSLFAFGMVGMMIGGSTAGLIGDRVGRKSALLGSVTVFALATLAMAKVNDVNTLCWLRFLAGLGLGGAMPNAAALASEYVPRRKRDVAVTFTIVSVPLGGMMAAKLSDLIQPHFGWRGLFVAGGLIPVGLALLLLFLLPESPRFLVTRQKRWPELRKFLRRAGQSIPDEAAFTDSTEKPAASDSLTALFVPDLLRDTLALWVAFLSCMLAVYTCFNWLPKLLTAASINANNGMLVFNLGGVFGALGGGFLISRLGSKRVMLALAGGAVTTGVLMANQTLGAGGAIMLMLVFLGGMINAVQVTMYALAAHVYPAAVRATGVGSAASFGRVGGLLSSYFGAWALTGTGTYFYFLAGSMAVSLVALAWVKHHVPPPACD